MATRQSRRRISKAGRPALAFLSFQSRQATLGVHVPLPGWVARRLDAVQTVFGEGRINAAAAAGHAEAAWVKARSAAFENIYGPGPFQATGETRPLGVNGPGF